MRQRNNYIVVKRYFLDTVIVVLHTNILLISTSTGVHVSGIHEEDEQYVNSRSSALGLF